MHNPEDGGPALTAPGHQGDVDGEHAVPLDEFLGAVEGIDQPTRISSGGVAETPLLRDDGCLGVHSPKASDNHLMRGGVCFSEWGVVVLGGDLYGTGAVVDLQNGLACPQGNGDYGLVVEHSNTVLSSPAVHPRRTLV